MIGNSQQRQSGFVLVSVIWLLVILSLAFVAFSSWVDNARNNAAGRQQQINTKLLGTSMFNRVIYTYMTGARTNSGITLPSGNSGVQQGSDNSLSSLGFATFDDFMGGALPDESLLVDSSGVLGFDGEIIDAGGGVRIMLQDRAGLIGLTNLQKESVFSRLIAGGQAQASANELRDILMDYQDSDSVPENNGAEAFLYIQQGLPVPTDGPLRTPLQLRALILWKQVLASYSDAWILQNFKVEGGVGINTNTASDDVIRLVAPDPDIAEQVIRQRKSAPFRSVNQIPSGGIDIDEMAFYLGSGGGLRFWRWHINHPIAEVYDVQFVDLAPGREALYFNWVTRAPVPEEMNNREATIINHAFFN